jgi:hypothetical protein
VVAGLREDVLAGGPRGVVVLAGVGESALHQRQREDDELVVEGAVDAVAVLEAVLAAGPGAGVVLEAERAVVLPGRRNVEVEVVLAAAAHRLAGHGLDAGLLAAQALAVVEGLVGAVEADLPAAVPEVGDGVLDVVVVEVVAAAVQPPGVHRQPLAGRALAERLLVEEVERRPDAELVLDAFHPVELPVGVPAGQQVPEVLEPAARLRERVVQRLVGLVRPVDVVREQQGELVAVGNRAFALAVGLPVGGHDPATSSASATVNAVTSTLSASRVRRRRAQRRFASGSAASSTARSRAADSSVVDSTRP